MVSVKVRVSCRSGVPADSADTTPFTGAGVRGGKCLKLMPSTEAVASTGDLRYDVDSQYSPSRQLIA